MILPADLVRNVEGTWGEDGRRWLAELPSLVDAVAAQWELTVGEPFALSFNWVARAVDASGTPVVLKLGPVSGAHLGPEAAALRAFDGRGAVRLLAADAARGALLLERATPGTRLREMVTAGRDTEATEILVLVANSLHDAAPDPALPDVSTLGVAFSQYERAFGDAGPLPLALVRRAGALFAELCGSAPRRVVLHGDLHHDNVLRSDSVLRSGDGWLAIDPHGYVGDPGFEAGAMLYNPDPDRADDALLAAVPRRIEQLADGLGVPLDRLTDWGFAVAMLSAVWDTEGDPGPPGRALDVARLLLR
ncbi:aminoglycoside phosphotransferase family protein [Cryptosporangium phraense]|uniref:aminoglycoside phosphotransferase family protein n=1 Tax=Cryptosporangium phraense TaxID=2593070 RepID=UPI0014797170|nr:aminoglycoside phosphotransferase family protein [Cryptosporangium phraense]